MVKWTNEVEQGIKNFDTHDGNPYWNGIKDVLNDPSLKQSILNDVQSCNDEDDNYNKMIIDDIIEIKVMERFWPQFINNLNNSDIDYESMDDEDIFDLLEFESDISENILMNFIDYLEDNNNVM